MQFLTISENQVSFNLRYLWNHWQAQPLCRFRRFRFFLYMESMQNRGRLFLDPVTLAGADPGTQRGIIHDDLGYCA
jgi:hypothetical protein